jgi:hypothetical protein
MARSSDIKIVRTNGPNPRNRYGIILGCLKKHHRKFLVEHRHIKRWAKDDKFIGCILRMEKTTTRPASSLKLYWDYSTNEVVDIETLHKSYNTMDWLCAISLKPIRAKFMNFDLENFIHPEYSEILDAPMVDSRILKSSIEFRKECKKLLLNERQEFLKLAKKNAKRSL